MAIRFIRFLLLTSCFDLIVCFGIYFALPDTQKLSAGLQIERRTSDGKSFPFMAGPRNKKYIRLDRIPKHFQLALILLEDARFYQHFGFDWVQIGSAVSDTLEDGVRLRGASTISQQLVKNLYLSSERSFRRKILEALITIKLELTLSKNQILELYFNSIDWGRGLFGISDATTYYFKKTPAELNVKQSIFLAAIIPNPSRFGKFEEEDLPKKFVRKQMMKALKELYKSGTISFTEFEDIMVNPYEFVRDDF